MLGTDTGKDAERIPMGLLASLFGGPGINDAVTGAR